MGFRKIRQKVAAVMTVVMLASTVSFTAMAEETAPKLGWILNDDGTWNFYTGAGDMVKGKEKITKGKWYSFLENGVMRSDELFESDDPDYDGMTFYAFPDGHLADKTWVKLGKDKKSYRGEGEYTWRYFNASVGEERPGEMVAGKEITIKEGGETQSFAFNEDGEMLHDTWVEFDGDGKIIEVTSGEAEFLAYYMHDGFRAADKNLAIDGFWYQFDETGKVNSVLTVEQATESDASLPSTSGAVVMNVEVQVTGRVASGSDAVKSPARSVESVVPAAEDTEIEYVPGEEVVLRFKVNLNDELAKATVLRPKDHDFWISDTAMGKVNINVKEEDRAKGICTVKYTPKLNREEEVYLYVDGKPSVDAYTLVPKTDLDPQQRTKAASAILSAVSGRDAMNPETVRTGVADIYKEADAEARKQLQKALLNTGEDAKNYEMLAAQYAMMNGIEEGTAVTEEAAAVLEDMAISLTGGSLVVAAPTAGGVDTVTLAVELEEDAPEFAEEQTAFDITLEVNGDKHEELEVPVKITMPVPKNYDVNALTLYHIHDDIEEMDFKKEGGKSISFMADRFSTYIFAQGEKKDTDEGNEGNTGNTGNAGNAGSTSRINVKSASSSPKSGSETGKWVLDENGWWYQNSDGTYPSNTWAYLPYGSQMNWYHFNKSGYMDAGWFVDSDGRTYYLNPASNGQKGIMLTGWQQIAEKWYYFNAESNGYKGAMLTDTTTPDGHYVSPQGEWVQK